MAKIFKSILDYLSTFPKISKSTTLKPKQYTESLECNNLKINIQNIVTLFRDFDIINTGDSNNQLKLRACILLIHSELESYFELIGDKVVNACKSGNLNSAQLKIVENSIGIYNFRQYDGSPDDPVSRINQGLNHYLTIVNQNNGIKEKDILKILLPLGIPLTDLDPIWLTTIDSFGSMRGRLGHKNINQITHTIGYKYIDETVYKIIIPGIEKLDKYIFNNYDL